MREDTLTIGREVTFPTFGGTRRRGTVHGFYNTASGHFVRILDARGLFCYARPEDCKKARKRNTRKEYAFGGQVIGTI